jgi:hypothetical protein
MCWKLKEISSNSFIWYTDVENGKISMRINGFASFQEAEEESNKIIEVLNTDLFNGSFSMYKDSSGKIRTISNEHKTLPTEKCVDVRFWNGKNFTTLIGQSNTIGNSFGYGNGYASEFVSWDHCTPEEREQYRKNFEEQTKKIENLVLVSAKANEIIICECGKEHQLITELYPDPSPDDWKNYLNKIVYVPKWNFIGKIIMEEGNDEPSVLTINDKGISWSHLEANESIPIILGDYTGKESLLKVLINSHPEKFGDFN